MHNIIPNPINIENAFFPPSAQDVHEEDGGGGPAPLQERRRGHGARLDHGHQLVPDILRVGTHGALRGALLLAGVHPLFAQRTPVRGPEEVDTQAADADGGRPKSALEVQE